MKTLEIMKEIETLSNKLNVKDMRVIQIITNNGEKQFYNPKTKNVLGKCFRQGDLYVHLVTDSHPVGEIVKVRQIAEGFSMGARHILVGDDVTVYRGVKLPSYVRSGYPLGYAFRIGIGGAILTHPEHAHDKCDFQALCQVTHQMDMRTLQRVSD